MKKIKKYMRYIILIILGIILSVNGFIYAKYITGNAWDFYLNSKNFYFNSDYLGIETIQNVNNQWDGGRVYFNVRNNLNQRIIANYNIEYKIECTILGEVASHAACYLNGTELSTQEDILTTNEVCINNTQDQVDVSEFNKEECELSNYIWTNLVSIKDLYFEIILTDEDYVLNDIIVNITVTSISPYNKVLSGDFILHKKNIKENNIVLDLNNYSNYNRLIVSNSYSNKKCVKISWDSNKLIIDSNDFISYNTDNGYINEIMFAIEGKRYKSFIFYNKDFDNNYTTSEFTIEETSDC